VNVTLIRQLAPAATVAPQDFATVLIAKSPLAAMLLMLSVAVPVLVRVMVLAPLFTPTKILPHFSEVGISVTAGPPPEQVGKMNEPMRELQLNDPLTASY
jgi:hypothetical protein